jgi:hypothetical protein
MSSVKSIDVATSSSTDPIDQIPMKTQGRSGRHEELLEAIAQEETRLEQIKAEQTDSFGSSRGAASRVGCVGRGARDSRAPASRDRGDSTPDLRGKVALFRSLSAGARNCSQRGS